MSDELTEEELIDLPARLDALRILLVELRQQANLDRTKSALDVHLATVEVVSRLLTSHARLREERDGWKQGYAAGLQQGRDVVHLEVARAEAANRQITALRAVVGEAKPLEWRQVGSEWKALSTVGEWWCGPQSNSFGLLDGFFASSEGKRREEGFGGDAVFARNLATLEIAKAACEEDYRQRLGAALRAKLEGETNA